MTPDPLDDLLTTPEVADLLGLDRSAVTRRAQLGELPARKLGARPGVLVYYRPAILAYLEATAVTR